MRWTFFVLLGANILLFGWHMLFSEDEGARRAPVPASRPVNLDIPAITLLQEQEVERSVSPVGRPTGETADADGQHANPLCTFIGPFDETERAEQLVERLSAMGVQAKVARVDIPAGPGYWVYLRPLASRREALRRLAELQAQGVDSYVIPRGELANGISLGMFSKEALARARMQEMTDMGIAPEMQVIERSHQEIWVSVPAAEASRLGEQAWARLLEGQKSTERKQNFCLHVASQDNFH